MVNWVILKILQSQKKFHLKIFVILTNPASDLIIEFFVPIMVNIIDSHGFSLNVMGWKRELATLTKLRDAFGETQALSLRVVLTKVRSRNERDGSRKSTRSPNVWTFLLKLSQQVSTRASSKTQPSQLARWWHNHSKCCCRSIWSKIKCSSEVFFDRIQPSSVNSGLWIMLLNPGKLQT